MECRFDDTWNFNKALASVEKGNSTYHINTNWYCVVFDENENLIEALDKVFDLSNNTFYLSRPGENLGFWMKKLNVVIKNSIYDKFKTLQRINETTFLIKIAGWDIWAGSEVNFR